MKKLGLLLIVATNLLPFSTNLVASEITPSINEKYESNQRGLENLYYVATSSTIEERDRVHLLILLYEVASESKNELFKEAAEHTLYYHICVFPEARAEYLIHYKDKFPWMIE